MRHITIAKQFRGPPNSGNGGYVCGLIARDLDGPATAVLRAIVPLDTELRLERQDGKVTMSNAAGETIATAVAASSVGLEEIPPPPSLAEARAAAARCPVIEKPFHPSCFTCSSIREEGDGLRILPGQIAGAPAGHLACVWRPHSNFALADGTIPDEIVWAALDCPGSLAWIVKAGSGGGLLGTMTGEVLRSPRAGEDAIVTAWPIANEGRKYFSGVALFDANGALMASGHQVWIARPPGSQRPGP